jgi:3-phosphoglycerate kinase
VTGSKFSADAEVGLATVEEGVPDGWMGLDVGPKSVDDFVQAVNRAKIIVWNGYYALISKGLFTRNVIRIDAHFCATSYYVHVMQHATCENRLSGCVYIYLCM